MSRAAEQLHVAQPALSKTIRALEEELETTLLQRNALGVTATEAGKRLYDHCQTIFQQVDRACLEVRKSGADPHARVSVGMPLSLAMVLALPFLKAASEQFPDVRLELTQVHSHQLAAQVQAGAIDFAVMARPRFQADITIRTLVVEDFFYVDRRSEVCRMTTRPISFAEAAQRPVILPSVGNGVRMEAERYFSERSLQLNIAHEIDAVWMIPRCVEAGLGASFLPGGWLQRDPCYRKLVRRRFENGWTRPVAVCHTSAILAPPAQALISLLERVVSDLVGTGQWLGAQRT